MKLIYTIILFIGLNCKADKDFSLTDNPLKRLIIHEITSENPYAKLIKSSIDKWELGIEYKLAVVRDTRTNTPKNWVQNSKYGLCQEDDLSSIKDSCLFNTYNYYQTTIGGLILAFCLVVPDSTGEIQYTTLVLNSSLIYDYNLSDMDRINAISHEIGHCLGLTHISDPENIMYPVIIPNKKNYLYYQKDSLRKGYYENVWEDTGKNYFMKTNPLNKIVKHEKLPTFYIKVDNTPNL